MCVLTLQIGLGSMGSGMALNLQKFLLKENRPGLIYYNRTIAKGKEIEAIGGRPATSAGQLASEASVIFSCVCA